MTGRLAELADGKSLEVWGPLGKPFRGPGGAEHVTLVAGGIGQTPFLAWRGSCSGHARLRRAVHRPRTGEERCRSTMARCGPRISPPASRTFGAAGVDVHLASDDGSARQRGFVTELLESNVAESPSAAARGMRTGADAARGLAKLAAKWNVPCQVSLETPMACGVGICFSCVTKVQTAEGWDYQRTCVDGPGFDAAKLVLGEA